MEKLPLLVHEKAITDHGGEDNVGAEHRLHPTFDIGFVWQAHYAVLKTVDLSRISEGVRAPLLFLAGEEDALFGQPHRVALHHAFPNAEVKDLAGHGHSPHWEVPALIDRQTSFLDPRS